MKAYVDKDLCIGCGLCEATCPSVFKLNDDSYAEVIQEEVPKGLDDCANEARENCPTDAISTED